MFDTYGVIFAERAGLYDGAMARWPDARRAEFGMVTAPLPLTPGSVLCDMPAGAGYLRTYLPDHIDYIAVEPSDHFYDRCPAGPTARRLQCTLTDVTLPNASADYVVSLAGLHHEPDLDAVFAEMRRVVRTDGWVVVADVNAGSASGEFLNGFVNEYNPMGHNGRFLDPHTGPRLAAAGLSVVADELISVPWTFDSVDDMGSYCRELFGIEDASVSQVVDALASVVGYSGGPGDVILHWPLRRLVCRPAQL